MSKWTIENLIQAVKISSNISGVCLNLNLVPKGKNYKTISSYIKKYNIDITHFSKKYNRSGLTLKNNSDKIFVENSSYKNNCGLKKYLFKNKMLENICFICKINSWNEKLIVLELDHINGIYNDNRLENLRLLCPNCHSQTETYVNKSKFKQTICIDCLKNIKKGALRCKNCETLNRIKNANSKIKWPPLNELKEMLKNSSYTALSKELGVSDNAIRKHIKNQYKLFN